MIDASLKRSGVIYLLLLLAPCAAVQASIIYTADLNGLNESPSNASPATGSATVEYDGTVHTLKVVNATFANLIDTTTAAHIHCCTASPGTGTAGVATITPSFTDFPLGVTSGTYLNHLFDLTDLSSFNSAFVTASGGTAVGAEAALAAGLAGGQAYFNIHTTFFPGGEIRGFLTAVPIPAAAWLFGGGLCGVMGLARRKTAIP
jgi:CHRD domain